MNNLFERICLLSVLIFIVGCSSNTTEITATGITGTEGLRMTVSSAPSTLSVGQGAQIPIIVENVGAADVENAILSVSEYSTDNILFSQPLKYTISSLKGKTIYSSGEKTAEVFTINSISLPNEKERKETVGFFACYPYKTEANPVVCINPQSVAGVNLQKGVCNFTDAKITSTQGAPLSVSKVETWYYQNKQQVEFRIYVKNAGSDIITSKEAYSKRCLSSDKLLSSDYDKVNIEVMINNEKIDCYDFTSDVPVDSFILDEKSTSTPAVMCRKTIDFTKQAYTTPLSITLEYGSIISKYVSITLQNPNYGR